MKAIWTRILAWIKEKKWFLILVSVCFVSVLLMIRNYTSERDLLNIYYGSQVKAAIKWEKKYNSITAKLANQKEQIATYIASSSKERQEILDLKDKQIKALRLLSAEELSLKKADIVELLDQNKRKDSAMNILNMTISNLNNEASTFSLKLQKALEGRDAYWTEAIKSQEDRYLACQKAQDTLSKKYLNQKKMKPFVAVLYFGAGVAARSLLK
jgi:hypothetical protein